MGVVRGGRIFKFPAKKVVFSFEWEKTNSTTFGPPGKILEKSPSAPPRKNPSDARVPESYWPWILLIFARFSITFTPIRISEKVFFQCRHSLIVPDNPQVIVAAFVVDSE